jgi:hypothetical protein
MRLTVLAVLALVLSGCASMPTGPVDGVGGDATFKHPTTGEIKHCVNNTTSGWMLGGVIGGVVLGSKYADCKTALEVQGYQRDRQMVSPQSEQTVQQSARVPTSSQPASFGSAVNVYAASETQALLGH